MACPSCGEVCTCGSRSASRAAVAAEPDALWPAADAPWRDAAWRREISSRVRAHRRKRGGADDDTLSLRFEDGMTEEEQLSAVASPPELPPPPSRYQRIAMKRAQAQYERGNLIVFPAPELPLADPVQEALAEPMPDMPRILDAEAEPLPQDTLFSAVELAPPPPSPEPHPRDLAAPLQVAPVPVQIVCWLVDSALALAGFAIFGGVVLALTGLSAAGKTGMALVAALAAAFWLAYQSIFLAYARQTPGMDFSGLGLCTFEDTAPPRPARLRRAAALVLSVLSLGMGFLWTLLDEDGLGWHDRISRTYLRPL